jgi:hypothetical protein
MLEKDKNLASETMDKFINTALNRVAENGNLVHEFKIPEATIKRATERERLKDSVVEDYVNFYAASNIDVVHDKEFGQLRVTLNLGTAVLDPDQAENLSVAMNSFRMGN